MVKRQWFGLASVSITVPEQLDTCDTLVTVRNVVAARLCFHRCLSFCSQGRGMYPNMHPGYTPWTDTPPSRPDPPRVDTPWADTLLPSACWDTPPRQTPSCPVHAGIHTPPGQIVLPGQTAPCPVHAGIHTPPWKDTPPPLPDSHCSGRSASYRNAFLFSYGYSCCLRSIICGKDYTFFVTYLFSWRE